MGTEGAELCIEPRAAPVLGKFDVDSFEGDFDILKHAEIERERERSNVRKPALNFKIPTIFWDLRVHRMIAEFQNYNTEVTS